MRAAQRRYDEGPEGIVDGLNQADAIWPHVSAAMAWLRANPLPETDRLMVAGFAGSQLLSLRLVPRELEAWSGAAKAAALRQGDQSAAAAALLSQGEGALLAGEADAAAAHFDRPRTAPKRRSKITIESTLGTPVDPPAGAVAY